MQSPVEILVIGASGLVGAALMEAAGTRAVGCGSRDADVRKPAQLAEAMKRYQPRWIVLTAAISNVDDCERQPELAQAVNAVGAENVARAAAAAHARLILLSTDYVFDGTKNEPYQVNERKRPLSVYARSKAEAEDRVQQALPDACIARTSWVQGWQRACFATRALNEARQQPEIKAVADKFSTPTYNRDLAQILLALIAHNARGIVHACNRGGASPLQLTSEVVRLAGIENVGITPLKMADMQWPAARPRYNVLSTASVEALGIMPRPWQEAMKDFVAERSQRVETR